MIKFKYAKMFRISILRRKRIAIGLCDELEEIIYEMEQEFLSYTFKNLRLNDSLVRLKLNIFEI